MSGNESELKGCKVGFIGGGNMAKAIVTGLISKGVLPADQIHVSALSESTLAEWKTFGAHTTHDNVEIFQDCDIIILAFKPIQLSTALSFFQNKNLIQFEPRKKTVVSLLAGVSLETITNTFAGCPIGHTVRAMPNLSVSTGEGCTALSWSKACEVKTVEYLFSGIGRVEVVPEHLMEPLSALIGCGPAFIFLTMEALADGCVKHGVPRRMANDLTAQMILGASKLVIESGKHPGQLKDEVCSPGGITIRGIHELERGGLRATFMNAIEAAAQGPMKK